MEAQTDASPQEIRGQGYEAAFSQKSDVYAFGCILYRLCTLENPVILDDLKPCDIPADYSMELLSLVCSMLSTDRDERPTALQIKDQLAAMSMQMFATSELHCLECHDTFPSRNQLTKHLKVTRHKRPAKGSQVNVRVNESSADGTIGIRIRGAAAVPNERRHYDENTTGAADVSPCLVCMRHFDTKRGFFSHMGGANHYRGPKYVLKRRAEEGLNMDQGHCEKRLA